MFPQPEDFLMEKVRQRGWIGVDLDGTLAAYDPNAPFDPDWIGEKVAPMARRVAAWLAEGREVRVFTARASGEGRDPATAAISRWCRDVFGQGLKVTAEKDYLMLELWDDRAVQVVPNRGTPVQNILAEAIRLLTRVVDERRLSADLLDDARSFLNEHDGQPYAVEV